MLCTEYIALSVCCWRASLYHFLVNKVSDQNTREVFGILTSKTFVLSLFTSYIGNMHEIKKKILCDVK